ncbi:hypothetical protein M0812_25585 [Anaeramoeba flamelloides]|uniref:RING-type E3 ubiquitin transferase n=1 Tax=Anaeramoeba flamelloides TaxID=1746091 RepID=A0AAV7YH33_9EUKA|nr:hypothetical protein M0812_25585 [Anaeramoeba flamelloides]
MSEQTNSNRIMRWCTSCGDVHTLDPKQWHKIRNEGGLYYLGSTPVSFTLIHDPDKSCEKGGNGHQTHEKDEFVCDPQFFENEKKFQQLVFSLQKKTNFKEEKPEPVTQRVTDQKVFQTQEQKQRIQYNKKQKSITNLEDFNDFGILKFDNEDEKEIEKEKEKEKEKEIEIKKEKDQKKEIEIEIEEENQEQENEPTLSKCGICFDTSIDPVLTNCGHLFCWPCLSRWLEIGKRTCPICKNPLRKKKHIVPIYNPTQNSQLKNHSYDKMKKLPRRSRSSRNRNTQRNGIRLPNGDFIPLNQAGFNFSSGLGSIFRNNFEQQFMYNRNQNVNGSVNGNEDENNEQTNRPEQNKQTVLMKILIILILFFLIVLSEFSYY